MLAPRILIVAALVGVAAACGSNADDNALSKEEFIRQGDALCQQFLDETAEFAEPTNVDELLALLDDAIARADRTLDTLKALDPPGDGEEVHDALVGALEDSLPKVRQARDSAADGDMATAGAAMDEAAEISGTSDAAAKAYGFQVCGSEEELRADASS